LTPLYMIRGYQPSDREQCRSLWRELTEWHRGIYQDPTIGGRHPEDYFDKHLAKVGPGRLWVAVHHSRVVGLVGLIVEENEAEIEPIIVSKAYRRRGIGNKLIQKVVSEAREMKLKFLNVEPVARNIDAVKFLYKQGFKNLGNIQLFISYSDYEWKPGPRIHGCEFNF
jgi:ribosomal protein S18 acetylase RimI-like enzyme